MSLRGRKTFFEASTDMGKVLCPSPFEKGGSRGICSARTKIPPTPLCKGGFYEVMVRISAIFWRLQFLQRKLLAEEINRILSATIKRLT
jgi:hypothetical protein